MTKVLDLSHVTPRPLAFEPQGDNRDLLEELKKRWEGRTVVRVTRRHPSEPVPIIELLSVEEILAAEKRLAASRALEKRLLNYFRFSELGSRSPWYKRAVLAWMLGQYDERGHAQKARELWGQLKRQSQAELWLEGRLYVLIPDEAANTLSVLLPDGKIKEIRYGTFQNYATELKKIRQQTEKS